MIDPIDRAIEVVDEALIEDGGPEHIVYALVEAGLIPTRGAWGVLDAGRVRTFGGEDAARTYAAKHGQKLVHYYEHDWEIVA